MTLGPPPPSLTENSTNQPTNKNRNSYCTFPHLSIQLHHIVFTSFHRWICRTHGGSRRIFPRQRRTPTPQREMTRKHTSWNYNNYRWWYMVIWSMFFGMNPRMKSISLVDVLLTNIEVKAICLFVSRNMLKTKETNVTSIWTGLTTAGKQAGHHPKSSVANFALNPKSVNENPIEKRVPWRSTVPNFYEYV